MARPQPEIKELLGSMDLDSPNEVIHPGAHRTARNGRFMGIQGNQQFQIIEGNSLIAGQNFLPDGVNLTIGRKDDANYQRVFYFNYNSNNNHGIYIYNTILKTFQTLIQSGIGTNGDVLNFTSTGRITSIDIIYGDPLEGDILYFLDSLGRPTKLNIQRYLSGTYNPIQRSFLNVIKAPNIMPPRCVYENDTTVNNNNCLNSLFKFAQAWIYDDNDQAVICSGSIQVLPVNQFSNTQNIPVSNDCRITLYLQTGDVNVKKIRIYMKQTQNGAQSDWLIVDTIDKDQGGIESNSIYLYQFYNDGNYTPDDIAYTDQLFDWVPDVAGNQCLPNGNVLLYGNVTEGYPWFKSNFSYNLTANPGISSINGHLFFADYNGDFTGSQQHIQIYLTGAGVNVGDDPHDLTNFANNYYVYATSNGTDISFSITGNASNNIGTILSAIQAAAVAAGWTFFAVHPNDIVLYYPTGNVVLKSYFSEKTNTTTADVRLAHYEQSNYSYGLVYFDTNGKTNGVITDISANLDTLPINFLSGISYAFTGITLNLNGIIPPVWAVSYAVVRTDTLTYNKYLNWISNQAFSNIGMLVVNQYAYIGISNIDDYNLQIQSTANVVEYGFAQGDRIRFNALYQLNGAIQLMNFDYQILGLEIDPLINGTPQIGRFIKIAYPTADIDPLFFKFDGDPNFQNYRFTAYNIAQNTTPQTENTGVDEAAGNVYYEIGLKFGIGNPGLNTAYHFGNLADNQVNIQDGDIFYRQRTVPTGITTYIEAGTSAFSNRYVTPVIQVTTPIVTPQYTINAQAAKAADSTNPANYPRFVDSGGVFLNTSGATLQIRLRADIQVTAQGPTWMDIVAKLDAPSGTLATTIPLLTKSDPISTIQGTTLDITLDATFGVPNGYKVWLIFGNGEGVDNLVQNAFQLRLDVVENYTIEVFDKSYSDVYNLITNSDNRPNVEDTLANTINYNTRYRWSQAYQLDTSLNNTNRFYFQDSDEAVKAFGAIIRISVLGKLAYVFQYRKCGTVGIDQKYIINNQGESELIVNDQIIEKNNIKYEIYEGGIGNQGGSLVISDYAHYFADPVKGNILRWSNDGVIIISLLYRTQTWAGNNLPNYLSDLAYQFGGNANVLGAFKIFKDKPGEYMLLAQGGTNGTITQPGEILSFDESKNSFTSFHDINCDDIVNAENTLYAFLNGLMYIHNNKSSGGYANFFGVNYPCQLELIFNKNIPIKKKYLSIAYQSTDFWISPDNGDINSSMINPQTGLQQISQLIEEDYEIQENIKYAAFLRDANSGLNPIIALSEGDYISGNWISILLEYSKGNFNFISNPYILYSVSGRNF